MKRLSKERAAKLAIMTTIKTGYTKLNSRGDNFHLVLEEIKSKILLGLKTLEQIKNEETPNPVPKDQKARQSERLRIPDRQLAKYKTEFPNDNCNRIEGIIRTLKGKNEQFKKPTQGL